MEHDWALTSIAAAMKARRTGEMSMEGNGNALGQSGWLGWWSLIVGLVVGHCTVAFIEASGPPQF